MCLSLPTTVSGKRVLSLYLLDGTLTRYIIHWYRQCTLGTGLQIQVYVVRFVVFFSGCFDMIVCATDLLAYIYTYDCMWE